jgi:hypothetical protein
LTCTNGGEVRVVGNPVPGNSTGAVGTDAADRLCTIFIGINFHQGSEVIIKGQNIGWLVCLSLNFSADVTSRDDNDFCSRWTHDI